MCDFDPRHGVGDAQLVLPMVRFERCTWRAVSVFPTSGNAKPEHGDIVALQFGRR